MKDKFDQKKFDEEYNAFLSMEPVVPPDDVKAKILSTAASGLRRTKIKSIASMFLMHIIAGAAVISVCPQFDIQFFETFTGLLSVFMTFGHHVCMFLCGSLFLSTSVALNALVLPRHYKQYLYSIRYYKIISLTIASLLFFSLASAVPFEFATLLWLLGAVITGTLSTKIYVLGISFQEH